MNLYVGITDTKWINFITDHQEEIGMYINFWRPGIKAFKVLEPGELFLFKKHANKSKGEHGEIVGGAYFYGYEKMSVVKAWDKFGFGNGANSFDEMRLSIKDYREKNNIDNQEEIGCIILEKPFFFEKKNWIEPPIDWNRSIVSGKKYSISDGTGYDIYKEVSLRLSSKK